MAEIHRLLREGHHNELGQFLDNQPRYLPTVAAYLANGPPQVRETAAWALHHAAKTDPHTIRFNEISNQLLDALDDDKPEVRTGAAATIGTIAKPDRLPQLGTNASDQLVNQMTDTEINDELYWTSYAVMRIADYAPREIVPYRDEIETVLQEIDQELGDEDYIDPEGEEPPHVLPHLKQILEDVEGG